jgi:hypothetical protein
MTCRLSEYKALKPGVECNGAVLDDKVCKNKKGGKM